MDIISSIGKVLGYGIMSAGIAIAGWLGYFEPDPEVIKAQEQINELQAELRILKDTTIRLGATTQNVEAPAFVSDSLVDAITTSATSFTLVSGKDKHGTNLASSTYGFVMDEGLASEEIVVADCSATACTNATRGISVITGTTTVTAARFRHGAGASVKITDAPFITYMANVVKGKQYLETPLTYSFGSTTLSAGTNQLASVSYVDGVALTGCGGATETAGGCVELSTGEEAASSTSSGSARRLTLPASLATSTPGNATTRQVVISENDGKLNQSWLDLSESFAFTSSISSTASTTFSGATTTINNLSLNNDDIRANGLSLRLPSQITASSTFLATDLNGKLIFDSPQIQELLTTTTASGSVTTIGATGLANRSHYTVILSTRGKTTSNAMELRFNGDQGNNYNSRRYEEYKLTGIGRDAGQISPEDTGTTTPQFLKFEITNVSTLSKLTNWSGNASTTIFSGAGEWKNATDAISAIQFAGGGGSFLINSKLWIYASRD